MAPADSFHYEVEKSNDDLGNKVTTVKFHGKLIAGTATEVNDVVKPLIALGGRVILDLADTNYMDSSGLGTLVGLKASAIRQGYCTVELVNMTPRVLELFRITKLTQLFS